MLFSRCILAATALVGSALGHNSTAPDCKDCKDVGSGAFHQHFVNQWIEFWNGDMSLLNQLAASDMNMYTDRVPSPTGNGSQFFPITSSKQFGEVVEETLSIFEKYSFDLLGWAGTGNQLAVRWTLDGILKANVSKGPSSHLAVNGTDFIFLDSCTGLIKTYDLAQDNINRYHQMGYTSIPV